MEFRNLRLYQPDGSFHTGELVLSGDRIAATPASADACDMDGLYAIPGLIDMHVLGCAGHDFGEADAFSKACDVLEKADDFEKAVHDLIKQYATEHYRIVFNGNGYSDEWVKEAERRGLPNISSMVDAIPALVAEDTVRLFEKFRVFTRAELESRAEIKYENYAKAINIEARTMIDMASKQIIPAIIKYMRI